MHYDASAEVRAKGAAFYKFSGDEEERRRQMEELRLAREETEMTRKDVGAVDLKPGEVEGMQEDQQREGTGSVKSRAMEKRKRELEDRRKMLDAKRRKLKTGGTVEDIDPPTASFPSFEGGKEAVPIPTFEAVPSSGSTSARLDPFAALETKVESADKKVKKRHKGKSTKDPRHAADDFLAQLEKEMLGGNSSD